MKHYAQLNEENICVGVSQLSGKVDVENMIELETPDASLLGMKYENGEWINCEPDPEPEPKPSQLDRIEEAVNHIAQGTTVENTEAINALLGVE